MIWKKYVTRTGNSTSQAIGDDEVVMRALYDQWNAVEMSKAQFYDFLD
jgi:hypothetical protein